MTLHLNITGGVLILLALLHGFFPRYFNWPVELKSLSLINRQMMYVHTLFIAMVLVFMGLLCLTSSEELISTTLGKRLALGLGIFWLTRLYIQFFGYSPALWKGKKLETAIHISFSALWTYLSAVFLLVYIQ